MGRVFNEPVVLPVHVPVGAAFAVGRSSRCPGFHGPQQDGVSTLARAGLLGALADSPVPLAS